jgi:serine/threonine protein kinase
MDPLEGRSLGPYVLEQQLGHGGMASVYRASHRQLKQARAIKVMSTTLAGRESFVQLFYREARLSARLRHPNVVQMYDIGEDGGLTYLVMELLEGRSLRDVIRQDGPLPVSRAAHFVQQLAAALQYAFISSEDHLTLVDFGIARAVDVTRLTVTHGIGTPEYMPPESFDESRARPNASDHDLGIDADLYALGVVAYELLTGALPITARTPQAVVFAQVHQTPAPLRAHRPDLSERLDALVLRQLSKDPLERIGPPEVFAAMLTDIGLADTIIAAIETPLGNAEEPSVPDDDPAVQRVPELDTNIVARNDLDTQAPGAVRTGALHPSLVQKALRQRFRRSFVALISAGLFAAVGLPVALQSSALLGTESAPITASAPTTSSAATEPSIQRAPATLAATVIPTVMERQATSPPSTAQPTAPPTPAPDQKLRDAQAIFVAGDYPQAINLLMDLKRLAPDTPRLDDLLFNVHLAYGEDLLDAQELDTSWGQFEAALELRPQNADAVDGKRQIVLAKNWRQMEATWSADPDMAINALETILQLDAGDRASEAKQKLYVLLIAKADRLLGVDDRDGAYTNLMKALAINPEQDEARRRLIPYTPTPLSTTPPAPAQAAPRPAQPAPQPQPQPQPAPQPQQPLRMPGRPT